MRNLFQLISELEKKQNTWNSSGENMAQKHAFFATKLFEFYRSNLPASTTSRSFRISTRLSVGRIKRLLNISKAFRRCFCLTPKKNRVSFPQVFPLESIPSLACKSVNVLFLYSFRIRIRNLNLRLETCRIEKSQGTYRCHRKPHAQRGEPNRAFL